MSRELERWQLIERSIIKKYHKQLWTPFVAALKQYALVQTGDHIAVCVSGGRGSMLLAKLMQQLQRHSDVPFELSFLVMDSGGAPEARGRVEENAALLRVPVRFLEADAVGAAEDFTRALYAGAQALGCNKIALGHHRDDVIETTVSAMFYGARLQGMMPKCRSVDFPGMELIRPMYCIREEDVIAWERYNELELLRCAAGPDKDSARERQRAAVKSLIHTLRDTNPDLENSIFRAVHAVNLDMFPGWETAGEAHSFLERY